MQAKRDISNSNQWSGLWHLWFQNSMDVWYLFQGLHVAKRTISILATPPKIDLVTDQPVCPLCFTHEWTRLCLVRFSTDSASSMSKGRWHQDLDSLAVRDDLNLLMVEPDTEPGVVPGEDLEKVFPWKPLEVVRIYSNVLKPIAPTLIK